MTDAGSPVQQLLEEIHRRSMWQILGVYLGTSWGTLEVLSELIDRLILPESVFRVAIVLLAVGLPIILATAYFEGSRRRRNGVPGGPAPAGVRRWFTWRNALLGGLAAFALLGMVATAFLASRALGVGFAAPLIAQGVLDERQVFLLSEFENRTSDPLLSRAVTEALRVDLAQSPAVRFLDGEQVRATLRLMERSGDTLLDERLAREVSLRTGIKAYLAGAVDQLGSGYTVSARLVSAESGADLIGLRESAKEAGDVINAVDRLSRKLRARIGESLGSVNATPPLPDVTTRSLPALERFAAGTQALREGDRPRAIRLLDEAVRLDSTFASAYRGLAIAHSNEGNLVASDRYAALARRYAERLPLRERYLSAAAYHATRGRRDSAAHYYALVVDAEPEDYVAVNNLGDIYEWMGRFEEALPLYRRAAELQPRASAVRVNLASIGRTLGMHALADSAVAAMEADGEPLDNTLPQRLANAIYARDPARVDSLVRTHPRVAGGRASGMIQSARAIQEALRGHARSAIASVDSTAALLDAQGIAGIALIQRLALLGASIAAGEPELARERLERWDLDELSGSPLVHSLSLALVAEAHARAGQLADAERLLARADSIAAAADFHQPGAVANARAVLLLSRDDAQAALAEVERAIAADFGLVRHGHRLTRALAYEALGRHREAAEDYERLADSKGLFWLDSLQFLALLPYAHERAGAAWLAAGDTARALQHLGAFTQLWADADATLQPRVRAAAATLEAILRGRG